MKRKQWTALVVALLFIFLMLPISSGNVFAANAPYSLEYGTSYSLFYHYIGAGFNNTTCAGNRFELRFYSKGLAAFGNDLRDILSDAKGQISKENNTGDTIITGGASDHQGFTFTPVLIDKVYYYYIQDAFGNYLKREGIWGGRSLTTTTSLAEATPWEFQSVQEDAQHHYWVIKEKGETAYLGLGSDEKGPFLDCWSVNNDETKFWLLQRQPDMNSECVVSMNYGYNGGLTYEHYTASYVNNNWKDYYRPTYSCSYDASKLQLAPRPISAFVKVVGYADSNGGVTKTVTEDTANNRKIVKFSWSLMDVVTGATSGKEFILYVDNHTWATTRYSNVDPTCTTDGYYVQRCTHYDTSILNTQQFDVQHCMGTNEVIVSAINHDWGTPSYSWSKNNSSCTATSVCKNDSTHRETETTTNIQTYLPVITCEQGGEKRYTAYFTNSIFGSTYKTEQIPALGHNWGEPTYSWSSDNSTCTATRICQNDALHVEKETVNSVEVISSVPTCTTDGSRSYTATFKKADFKTQTLYFIDLKLGHDWGAPIYSWSLDNSTCTATRVCKNDPMHVEKETANATDTKLSIPDCTTNGAGKFAASFANPAFNTQEKPYIIPMLNHAWGEASYMWADDHSTCTAARTCLHDPKHKESEQAVSVSQVIETATAEHAGKGKYIVAFANPSFKQQEKPYVIAVDGSKWSEAFYSWSADGKSCTAHHTDLDNKQNTVQETVLATETIVVSPTQTKTGKGMRTATFKNICFETQTVQYTIPSLENENDSSTPNTGDPAQTALWLALMLCSTFGAVIFALKRSHKKDR